MLSSLTVTPKGPNRTEESVGIHDTDTDDDEDSDSPNEHAFDQGEEWPEQITPSITVEWRPLIPNKRIRHRCKGPAPWQVDATDTIFPTAWR